MITWYLTYRNVCFIIGPGVGKQFGMDFQLHGRNGIGPPFRQ